MGGAFVRRRPVAERRGDGCAWAEHAMRYFHILYWPGAFAPPPPLPGGCVAVAFPHLRRRRLLAQAGTRVGVGLPAGRAGVGGRRRSPPGYWTVNTFQADMFAFRRRCSAFANIWRGGRPLARAATALPRAYSVVNSSRKHFRLLLQTERNIPLLLASDSCSDGVLCSVSALRFVRFGLGGRGRACGDACAWISADVRAILYGEMAVTGDAANLRTGIACRSLAEQQFSLGRDAGVDLYYKRCHSLFLPSRHLLTLPAIHTILFHFCLAGLVA